MHLAQYAPNTSLNTNWEIVQDQHQWMRTAILLLLLLCFAENLINRTTHAYWLITQLSLFLFLWLVRMWCHTFNGPFSGTTQVSWYQKAKTNLDFTEARDSEWQWHQLDHMQVCTSLQTHNHAGTPPLSFLQAGCPSCRPTNSVKALKALVRMWYIDC